MIKKSFLISLLLLASFFIFSKILVAQNIDTSQIQNQINEYTQKLSELGKAKDTLANQIKILDSQIQLNILKINQTENSVNTLEKEIDILTAKIIGLDSYLNQLSSAFIHQINQNYKLQKRIPFISILLTSKLNNFLEQYKYATMIQKNSQDSLINLETARVNYDLQKQEKSKKQQELEGLQKKLADQKLTLARQKVAKDTLLISTKNDEKKYQQMLSYAQSQLNALRNFSQTEGSSCLTSSPGGGSDGQFFSQRDPKWCGQIIGLSNDPLDTIGKVGCYISSVSIVFKKLGMEINPSAYAYNPSNFSGRSAWMNDPVPPPGYVYKKVNYSSNVIDNELKNNRYVIAQILMKNISGMHFIVIIGGSNGNYKMHDPWYGSDLNFSDRYSISSILSLRLITK